jgi:aerobic carbon-monoxide dehydrogenase small subunit
MAARLRLTVNGDACDLPVDAHRTLLWVLREGLGLTGTKEACAEGECGACTVLMDGKSVNACLVLALQAEDADVVTIEGLAVDGRLHRVQEAFVRHSGLQCGFCTAGMIMQATALLAEHPAPTEAEVRHGLEGNLCRCTGYAKIVAAILAAAGPEAR